MKVFTLFFFLFFYVAHAVSQFSTQQEDRPLTIKVRQQLMDSLIKQVEEGYVFEDKAMQIGKALKMFQKTKAFAEINTFQDFITVLNEQFRQISHDKHLALLYSFDSVTAKDGQEVAFPEFIKQFAVNNNYGFNKIDILPGNIGYMNILGFFPFEEARDIAAAAFAFLQNTSALIVDLRQNNGGESNMANFVVSYFFEPEPVVFGTVQYRKNNRVEQSWSAYYLPGKRYLGKPVYVLTGPQTFSAGEGITSILQSYKKAVVVGEKTGGGANMCELVRLNEHIVLNLPVASHVGLREDKNWEGNGIIPDIATSHENALEVAEAEALKKLQKSK